MKFRSNYNRGERSPGINVSGPSRTKQEFKDECDINNIIARYRKTGVLPHLIKQDASYGDFSDVGSYQEACNIVLFAQEQFAALPASTRDRFANDPSKFLEFVNDPKNADEMVRMGLAQKKGEPAKPASPVRQADGPATPKSGGKSPRQQPQEPADE